MAEVQESSGPLRVTELRFTQDALTVRYSLRGEDKAPVWVVDELFTTSPAGYIHLEPERAYVEAQGSVLVLTRALLPVPDDLDVESPEVPCVRRLSPGESLTGEIRVPLPPREEQPYRDARALDLATLRSVKLRIGYLPDSPELELHEMKDDVGRPCRYPSFGPAITRQRFADVGPLPLPARPTP
jgi:hypothetical protein